MNIDFIKKLPTSYKGDEHIHESVLKGYNILEYVMKLVERGVDKETIKEIVEYLRQ